MKTDIIKNIILFFSCIVSMSSLLLTCGFYFGSNIVIDKAKNSLVDSSNYQISIKEYYDSADSPIRLVRTSRPSREDIAFLSDAVPSAIIANDYANLFPGDYQLSNEDKLVTDIDFVPIHSFSSLSDKRDLMVMGTIPISNELSDICINEKALERLDFEGGEAVGHLLSICVNSKITYAYDNVLIEDMFYFESQLRICAVFKELSFLNEPKIFYSHSALERILEHHVLEDISEATQNETTVMDLFSLVAKNDFLTNYRLRVFIINSLEIPIMDELSSMLKRSNSSIVITSDASLVKNAYEQLTHASFYSMLAFVFVAVLGTCSIMAIGTFSNYVFNKKDSAILSCLGARQKDIRSIFLRQSTSILCASALISIGVSIIAQQGLNSLLEEYASLTKIIDIPWRSFLGIPFAIPLFLLIIALCLSFVFTTIPLSLYKSRPVLHELRDE